MRALNKRFFTLETFSKVVLSIGIACAFVLSTQLVFAAPNLEINYQGKLTDDAGVTVPNGTYNMRFWLLTSASIATTSAEWTESLTGSNRVQVTNGLFSVMLGSTTPLTSVDFNQTLYLGVEIGGTGSPSWDGEMSPRKVLGTVPAAFVAETANNASLLGGVASTSFLRTDQADAIAASTASTLLTITQSGVGDILNVFDGVTEVFTILDGGSVGIGTSSPLAELSVDGDVAITGGIYDNNATRGSNGQILQTTGSGLQWVSTTTLGLFTQSNINTCSELAAILSGNTTGTCGTFVLSASPTFTGTVLAAAATLSSTLTMSGTAANIALGSNWLSGDGQDEGIYVGSTGNVGIGTTSPNQALSLFRNGADAAIEFSTISGTNEKWTFGIDDSDGAKFKISSSSALGTNDRFVIDGRGYVGIGTPTPDSKLTVVSAGQGTNPLLIVSSNGNDLVSFRQNSSSHGELYIDNASEVTRIKLSAGASSYITGGNLGIGTTTPTQALSVVGTTTISAGLLIGSGEVGDLAYSFNADTNTGIYNPGNNALSFVTGGTERLYIVDGNIGIGTTTPVEPFHWVAANNNDGFRIQNNDVNEYIDFLNDDTDLEITFNDGSDIMTFGLHDSSNNLIISNTTSLESGQQFVFTSDGSLGIGTTSPNSRLTIEGQTPRIALFDTDAALSAANPTWAVRSNSDGSFYIQNSADNSTFTDRFSINATGDATMGENLTIGNASSTDNDFIYFDVGTESLKYDDGGGWFEFSDDLGINDSTPTLRIQDSSGTDFDIAVDGGAFSIKNEDTDTTLMHILSTGLVGIGTTTPTQELSVVGDVQISGRIYGNNNSAGTNGMVLQSTGTGFNWVATSTLGLGGSGGLASTDIDTCSELAAILSGQTTGTCGSFVLSASPAFTGTVTAAAATLSSTLTMSGSSANIALGSNYLSGDGNDEGIYIDSSGNVGIGTTSPDRPLHIQNVNAEIQFTNSSFPSVHWQAGGLSNGRFAITQGGVGEPISILPSSGYVGIGTSSPSHRLHVSHLYGPSSAMIESGSSNAYLSLKDTSREFQLSSNAGTFYVWDQTSSATRLSIDSTGRGYFAGNFGIGTTTPNQKLSVFANGADAAIEFSTISGANEKWTFGIDDSDGAKFKISSSSALGTNDRLVINGAGYVGIGTSAPDSWLTVLPASGSSIGSRFYNDDQNEWIDINDDDTDIQLSFEDNTAGVEFSVGIYDTGDSFRISNSTGLNTNPVFTITSGTRLVGIGTTTPTQELSVIGDLQVTGRIYDSSNSAGTNGMVLQSTGTGFTWVATSTLGISGGSSLFTDGGATTYLTSVTDRLAVGTTTAARLLHIDAGTGGTNVARFESGYPILELKDSSASFPGGSIDWTMNDDTVLWRIGSRISVGTNNWEIYDDSANLSRFFINPSGNIGIGTSSPNQKFSIFNNGADAAIEFSTISGANEKWSIGIDDSDGAKFKISSSSALGTNDRLVIDGAGRVGIGTTTPTRALLISVDDATDAASTQMIQLVNSSGNTAGIGFKLANSYNDYRLYNNYGSLDVYNVSDGVTNFRIDSSGNVFLAGSGADSSPALTATVGGRVGIGTTTPNQKLSIFANGADAAIEFSTISGANEKWSIGIDDSDGAKFKISSSSALGTNDRLVIDGAGNVGIGTVSPQGKLDVANGNIQLSSGYVLQWGDFVNKIYGINDFGLYLQAGGTDRLVIRENGNVGIGTSSPISLLSISSSDSKIAFNSENANYGPLMRFSNQGTNRWGLISNDTLDVAPDGSFTIYNYLGSGNPSLTILQSGNVGIGTTTPAYDLVVNSADDAYSGINVFTDDTTQYSGASLNLTNTAPASTNERVTMFLENNVGGGGGTAWFALRHQNYSGSSDHDFLGYYLDGSNSVLNLESLGELVIEAGNDDIEFFTNSTERMTVKASGNIGIGTSTPTSLLYVNGGNITQVAYGNSTLKGTYNTSGTAYGVAVSGKYAYVADQASGLQIIDISNPALPTLEGTYDTSGSALGVAVSGKYAYVADGASGLQVIDISNPTSPSLVGTYDLSGSANSVYVSGKYGYVADGAGLSVIDISNPTSPSLVGSYGTGGDTGYDVYVSGKYAYLANGGAGLLIIDISKPTSPSLMGTYNTSGWARDVYVSGKYAYIAGEGSGLQVIDISNPTSPSLVGTYDTSGAAQKVYVAGSYAYVADEASGLHTINISSSTAPFLVGTYNTSGNAYDVYISGKYAYVSDGASGLQIVDINGAEFPSLYAGNIETNVLNATENIFAGGDIYAQGGLNVGISGIFSRGALGVFTASTTATNPISATFMGGRVGIGTTTPTGLLDVVGNSFIRMYNTSTQYSRLYPTYLEIIDGSQSTYFTSTSISAANWGSNFSLFTTTSGGSSNTNQLYLHSNNNIGFGTSTPNQALSIFRNGLDAAIEFSTISGSAEKWTLGVDDSDGNKFKISSSSSLGTNDRFVIDGNGYVGINDTTPDARLDVETTAANNYVANFINSSATGRGVYIFANNAVATQYALDVYSTTGALFRLNNAGNLGLGTSTANQAITIFRNGLDAAIEFSTISGSAEKWTLGVDDSDGNKFKISSSSALGTNDRLVIDGAGRVGIGDTTPDALLDAEGSIAGNYIGTVTNTSATGFGQYIYVNNTSASTYSLVAVNSSGGGLHVRGDGRVGVGSSTPSQELSVGGDVAISGRIYDNNASAGSNGMVLQSTGTGFNWVATSSLGISGGASLFTDGGAITYLTSLTDEFNIGTTTATSTLSLVGGGTGSTGVFSVFNSASTMLARILNNGVAYFKGAVGVGTQAPSRVLDVLETNSVAQVRLSKSLTYYAELLVDGVGDLYMSTVGGNVFMADENLSVCEGGACSTNTATSTSGNIFVENAVTIGDGFSLRQLNMNELGMYNASGTLMVVFDSEP